MTVTVQQSQPLTLECVASGSPAPTTRWFKNGKEVTQKQPHSNLEIAEATTSDEGIYICAAETAAGTVTSGNYTVKVVGERTQRMSRVRLSGVDA